MRTGGRWCGLKAISREAHFLGALFAGWVGALSWSAAESDFGWRGVSAAIALTLLGTLAYILIAVRMSAPAPGPKRAR